MQRYPNDPSRYGHFGAALGRYATLLWQRGEARRCLDVLNGGVELVENTRATQQQWDTLIPWGLLDIYHLVAVARRELGQHKEAVESLRRLVALGREREVRLGQNPQARRELARGLFQLGVHVWLNDRTDGARAIREALAQIRQNVEQSGDRPADRQQLARYLLDCPGPAQRDVVSALQLARGLVKGDPEFPEYRVTLASALGDNGEHAAALTELNRVMPRLSLPANPLNAWEFLRYMAAAKWHLGDRAGAEKHLQEAIALKPYLPIGLYNCDYDAHHRLCKHLTEGPAPGSR